MSFDTRLVLPWAIYRIEKPVDVLIAGLPQVTHALPLFKDFVRDSLE